MPEIPLAGMWRRRIKLKLRKACPQTPPFGTYIANAASKTATVWWVQGFGEEDVSFKNTVTEYEKASGNTIDYTLMPFAPHRQKIVSALTSGIVPDPFPNNPMEILALYAWDNKLVDVSDVIETQKSHIPRRRCLLPSATTASRSGVPIIFSGRNAAMAPATIGAPRSVLQADCAAASIMKGRSALLGSRRNPPAASESAKCASYHPRQR
jgi:hypothetical protein